MGRDGADSRACDGDCCAAILGRDDQRWAARDALVVPLLRNHQPWCKIDFHHTTRAVSLVVALYLAGTDPHQPAPQISLLHRGP
jgi:hypothetical protein